MPYYYDRDAEISQAINAGRQALSCLNQAKDELRKARNWGIADMLGGGTLITLAKHSKLRNAQNCLEQAKASVMNFSRELQDVNAFSSVDFGISDFLVFADYFFDGFIADFMVQQKINEAAAQVDEAIRRIQSILSQLERM